MNFEFSAEQDALREQLRKFLAKESPRGLSRQLLDGDAAGAQRRDAVWRGLAELGVTALMLPEDCGGIGLGAMELCVVAEEIGRQLSPVPLASTLYLAAQALLLGASGEQQQRWLSAVAAGEVGCLAAPLDGQI
ncbi:MAG TPA: acyl-CoA dehydrogenase family protein, partial [Rubrivivax sp.]|nr:acyl-CoA dehydrogenase family protein [Rubrivivax sp.]